MKQKSPKHLSIEVMLTYRCNFRCAYCYEKPCEYQNVDITDETKNNIFKYIDTYRKNNPETEITVFFWGGEPTLKLNVVEEFIDKYKDDLKIDFLIFTNGLIIKELVNLIKKSNNKLKIQISYDFFGQKRRIITGGQSSKEQIKKSIKYAFDNGIDVKLKSTILLDDLPFIDKFYNEFVEMQNELGDKNNISLTLTPDTTVTWNKSEEQFDKMMIDFKLSLKELLKLIFIKKNFNFNWLYQQRSLCTAGKNYFMVDIDGKIYPCHGTAFLENKEKEHCIGHITDIENTFNLDFDIFDQPDKCKNCDCKVCFRCNAHVYMHAKKNLSKHEKWVNFANVPKACLINKEISKMSYAFDRILEIKREKNGKSRSRLN